jgi:RNA polymerase sigma factor (TIGR02999 family)
LGEAEVKNTTELLLRWRAGDANARDRLMVVVYEELRQKAAQYLRRERAGHTLQPTALVHETFLRLLDQHRVEWQGRAHFLAVAASMMRRVLMDYGRKQKALKRGGGAARVTLDANIVGAGPGGLDQLDLLALDEALQELEALDEQQVRIVELRAFGGLSVEETAEVLGISPATVKRHWAFALAWLKTRLQSDAARDPLEPADRPGSETT